MESATASSQGACYGRAIIALESYYDDLRIRLKAKKGITTRKSLPYRTYYEVEEQDSERRQVEFTYQERIYENRLMFTAKDIAGNLLFIKFTQQYSVATHKYYAEHGVAPGLYAAEEPPGGWFMIFMNYLDDIYDDLRIPSSSDKGSRLQLCAKVKQPMEKLHSGGFVHGDLRSVNLKVRKKWKENTPEQDVRVMRVNFNWAGKAGEARHPANVNHQFY
ncbi:hypothetical protein CPB86DRAFT_732121 [Serendipita vermifera]|nr:hypothetical protein CPB86DRAFT_732121 [Serendipita vermifera]